MKKLSTDDSEDDGTRHFMVNVIEPQFNLHSEDANVSCKGYFSFRIFFFFFCMRFFSQKDYCLLWFFWTFVFAIVRSMFCKFDFTYLFF